MKKTLSRISLILLAFSIFSVANALSQERFDTKKRIAKLNNYKTEIIDGYKVVTGERPPIDLDKVRNEAFETGKIFIKLKPNMEKSIPEAIIKAGLNGYVKTGIPTLDAINKEYGAKQYTPILDDLYKVSPKSKQFQERHNAWGFNLWFIVELDTKADIKEAVKKFSTLNEIETAEPVYKKRRILPVESGEIRVEDVNTLSESKWTPNDPLYANNQWHYNNTGQTISGVPSVPGIDIKAQDAWEIEKGNSNVIVSIHDAGVKYNHPDLSANMWSQIGPEGTGTQADNHGTHVAGTIAAVTNNGVGVAGIAGGSGSGDGVRIMSIDIFEGSISTYQGYVYAANNGSSISQNSWGYLEPNVYNSPDLSGIDYFTVNGGGDALLEGGIVIFAAGNDNDDGNWYPAYYASTLSVASHTNKGLRSGFSNYGTWVDICAPGSSIASTGANTEYMWMSGTSMACPHVSGVAALVVSMFKGEVTKDELWEILLEGVDEDLYDYNPSYIGKLGSGRTNAYKTLTFANSFIGYAMVSTSPIINITESTATSGGNVTLEGNSAVTAKGVVWGKLENPTVEQNDGITLDGNGLGEYTSEITSLDLNTKYFVRSYATNGLGTSYGDTLSFRTLAALNILVVDSEKNPINGAIINIEDAVFTSGSNGLISTHRSQGSYDYSVYAAGFISSSGTIVINEDSDNTRKVMLYTQANAPATLIGEESVCRGSELVYNINIEQHNQQWEIFGGVAISTSSRSAYIRWSATSGNGYVRFRVIDNDDYHTTIEKTIVINHANILVPGNRPKIYVKGDIPILICTSPDFTYRWIKDGFFISGETEQFYAARNQSGAFQVEVIDNNQCPNTSVPVSVESSAKAMSKISTYPNPTSGEFTLSFESNEIGEGELVVTNTYGKVIYQQKVYKTGKTFEQVISLPNTPKGIYVVHLRIGNISPSNTKLTIY